MSKFKVGDIVRFIEDKDEAEVIEISGSMVKVYWGDEKSREWDKEYNGFWLDDEFELVKPKKEDEMPKIEVGSKWTDGEFVVTVVYVSEGVAASVFFVHEDGSGGAEIMPHFTHGEWTPYKEPKTITRWTYVYRDMDSDELEIDSEIFETEEDAIDDAKMVLCRELIKTLKIEYTEE